MPLYIKDDSIDELAKRLQIALKVPSKTEAVRLALQRALDDEAAKPTLPEIAVNFCRDLRARANPAAGLLADKAFRDSLYEEN